MYTLVIDEMTLKYVGLAALYIIGLFFARYRYEYCVKENEPLPMLEFFLIFMLSPILVPLIVVCFILYNIGKLLTIGCKRP